MTKGIGITLAAAFLLEAALCTGMARAQEAIPAPNSSLSKSGDRPLEMFLANESTGTTSAPRQLWVTGDFLLGLMRGAHFPVLATTSPAGTARPVAGIFGASSTDTLFGGWQIDDPRAGFRLGAGWWFGGDRYLGVETGVLFLGGRATNFNASSDNFPILARPYLDVLDGTPQAVLVAFPGSSTGSIDIHANSGNFQSAYFDIAEKAFEEGGFRLVALVGYRYYRYDESLTIGQILNSTDPNFVAGTQVVTNDSFSTRNEFHGLDMGFRTQYAWNKLSLEVLAKLAVGDLRRQVNIDGNQTVTVPGAAAVTDAAGVFALDSNSGTFISHDFKVLPEFGATLNWQCRPNLNVRFGYSFLLLNGIARAADQVDVTLNPNLFPPANPAAGGANRPAFSLHRSEMWIQSVNLGVEWTY